MKEQRTTGMLWPRASAPLPEQSLLPVFDSMLVMMKIVLVKFYMLIEKIHLQIYSPNYTTLHLLFSTTINDILILA